MELAEQQNEQWLAQAETRYDQWRAQLGLEPELRQEACAACSARARTG